MDIGERERERKITYFVIVLKKLYIQRINTYDKVFCITIQPRVQSIEKNYVIRSITLSLI